MCIEIDFSLPALRVICALERVIDLYNKPQRLRVDNGPEFIAQELEDWTQQQGIQIQFIQKGSPTQNAFIERFNGSYQREVLDAYLFATLAQVRAVSENWLRVYNFERPHEALGNMPPISFKTSTSLHIKPLLRSGTKTGEVDSGLWGYRWPQAAIILSSSFQLRAFRRPPIKRVEGGERVPIVPIAPVLSETYIFISIPTQ